MMPPPVAPTAAPVPLFVAHALVRRTAHVNASDNLVTM